MTVMTATAQPFPEAADGPFTVRDLEAFPNDGRHYEVIDGVLVVGPAPVRRHQMLIFELYGRLRASCPDEFDVIGAPFAVHDGELNELQPDIVVGRFEDFTEKDLPKPPVLAVEVLSPSTRRFDLLIKRSKYAEMGVPSYWVVDPDGPAMRVFELDSTGEYQQVQAVAGEEEFVTEHPFPVRFRPIALLGRLADKAAEMGEM